MRACLLLLTLAALAWQPAMASMAAEDDSNSTRRSLGTKVDAWQTMQASRITEGDRLLAAKQPQQAIAMAFDPLIADYEAKYASDNIAYYCARTSVEGSAYMIHAAAEHSRTGKGQDARLLDHLWAYGHYGKAFALIELGQLDAATAELEKALKLSPYNPQFLSQRGFLYMKQKAWQEMLQSNLSAEEFVPLASPDDRRDIEHARALRGQGFALIELDRLQEAEAKFLTSLKLDPTSQVAREELDYIEQLKAKAAANQMQ